MREILLTSYEFLTSIVPYLVVSWIWKRTHPQALPTARSRMALVLVFAFYVTTVFHLTGAGTLYDALLYQLEFRPDWINLIPFSSAIDVTGYLQNVLLFVPFGILVPLLWRSMDSPVHIAGSALAFSLLIELSQLLNPRRTDIDDLILNTLGALAGYVIFRLLHRMVRPGAQLRSDTGLLPAVCVLFAGRFLFFYEMAMAKLLYGFS